MLLAVLAVLYDIHGNLTALEAILADAESAGAASYFLGGDYCMMGAEPAGVLERLEQLPADTLWIRGNTERWVYRPEAIEIPVDAIRDSALFVRGAIGKPAVDELAALPDRLTNLPHDGAAGTIFCHASPSSDMVGFTDQPADTDAQAARNHSDAKTIVCGHTHIQFEREIDDVRVVNPGSVGLPFDGDTRAAYALLAEDGSFDLRRVEYDVEAAIAAYGALEGPWVEIAKNRLLTARP